MTVYQYSDKYWFDFENTLIEIQSPYVAVDIQELIDAIRTTEAELYPGIGFDKIADASGKEELGTSVYVGITLKLLNGWQVHFWVGNYIATISGGNLVGGPADDPIAYSAGVQVLLILSASSTIVSTGGSALTQEEHDQLMSLPDEDVVTDAVWDEPLTAVTHNVPTSAGRRLRSLEDAVEASVNDPSPTVSGFITTLTSAVDSFYDNQTIHFIEGDLDGSTRIIDTYTGSTKYVTFDEPWTSAPADGDDFHIHATHLHPLSEISESVWSYVTRTITSFGTLVSDIWSAGTRTLTSFGTLQTAVEDALGLIGENVRWSGMAFDSNDNLISSVITQYEDNTLAVERKKWQLTATYDTQSRLTSHELKEY